MLNTKLHSRIQSIVHSRVRSEEVCPEFAIGLDDGFLNHILVLQPAQCATGTPCFDDYEILRTLGTGAHAVVYLVREKQTSHLYALKAVYKYTEAGRRVSWSTVINERTTLMELSGNDFILPLHACFHDTDYFYFVTVSAHVFCPCINC